MTVLDPFPHAGSSTRKAKCAITAIFRFPGEELARTHAVAFAEFYGAKRWLELMMGNEAAVRRGHELVLETSGIKIRSFQLDKILGYKYKSDEEARYQLPDNYISNIARFRRGRWHEAEVESTTTQVVVETKAKKVKKPTRPEGYITITELCRGTTVQPMDARALLRASNMKKPDFGWAFAPNQIREVKRIIGL